MENTYEAVRRLMIAINKISGAYYISARKAGVNENTLALLYALDDDKAHSQKQICEEWLIPKTTVNTIVKELAAAGYVTLLCEEHTREKVVSLTVKGKEYTQSIMKNVYEVEQEALQKTLKTFSPQFVNALALFSDCICEGFETQI